jgi:DNA-binding response OmpR family regulator
MLIFAVSFVYFYKGSKYRSQREREGNRLMAKRDLFSILVVENERVVARLLKEMLQIEGYQVVTVFYGEDAVQSTLRETPHLLLLDMHLPDMDGYEVIRRLRSRFHLQSMFIPIIALSALDERAARVRALELGADDYITKPFDSDELVARVRVQHRRTRQNLLPLPMDWSYERADMDRAREMPPIHYHSCFISYSSKDDQLAKRLHADLLAQGVRCWFAPEDLKIGDRFHARINEAIHVQDKLLLLFSESAIQSDWVEIEVRAALEKERRQHRDVLFPVRLDSYVMDTSQAWAALLRQSRHIGDFTNWTDPQAYQQAFERLLRDLKKADEPQNEEKKP